VGKKTSIIIINYKTPQLTINCIDSLYTYEDQTDFEIILLDNGSMDGSVLLFKDKFPKIKLIDAGKNHGFAAGNNIAVKEAIGEYLLFINSDTILTGSVLKDIEATMEYADVGIAAPRLLNMDKSIQESVYKFPTLWRAFCESFFLSTLFPKNKWVGDYRKFAYNKKRVVDFASGACLLIKRDLFNSLNGFDERFFMYAEETDLAFRLHKKGYRTYFLPVGDIIHLGGASGVGNNAFKEQFCLSKVLYYKKHYGAVGLKLFLVMQIMGFIIRNSILIFMGKKEKIAFNRKVIRFYAKSFFK